MGRADVRRARLRWAQEAQRLPYGGRRRRFRLGWKGVLGTAVALAGLGLGVFFALYLVVDVPDGNPEATAQRNAFTFADGSLLAREGDFNRELVPINRVPKGTQYAFVAAENKTFYQDPGIDVKGLGRGLLSTLMGQRQGGSTITQQYVKNYFLSQEQTVSRKAKELIIALKVDQQQSKDEILAGYMNTSYFGRGAYGVQAAAKAYYDTDVEKLSVAQSAYLAALLQAPSQYDLAVASPGSRRLVTARWNFVLDNMVEQKWLDPLERRNMVFPEPGKPEPNPGLGGQAGYFVEAAKAELIAAGVDEQELAARGWNIELTIDPAKQRELEEAVEKTLLGDLDPESREVDGRVQPGAVSVDPETGAVVAMYGGRNYVEHFINNATRQDYQPASTFKPVVLAAAFETGATTQDGRKITPATVYDGTSGRPVEGSRTAFSPPNEDEVDYGPITVQQAMNNSVNSVFAQMAVDVGLERTKQTGIQLGMQGDAGGFDVEPAMSLGAMGASPLDMAAVYATLDNHGKKVKPRLVKSATRGDRKVDLPDPIGEQMIDRRTADTVTDVLRGVVNDGTARGIRSESLNFAGKTGTSDDNKSAWFAGYTPDLVTTVALFGEGEGGKQVSLSGAAGGGRVNGGGYPARIWAAYTQDALGGRAAAPFDLDVMEAPPETPSPSPVPEESEPEENGPGDAGPGEAGPGEEGPGGPEEDGGQGAPGAPEPPPAAPEPPQGPGQPASILPLPGGGGQGDGGGNGNGNGAGRGGRGDQGQGDGFGF
ncbi:transglycosylase domain-containing protein [Streptomyces zingiberis]|uniref:Penicillin-binding protein n=1 Tax=Streptomyces zingiberis TaxID=2053010 RepID=A0ABX1BYT6_9ACTN|nr:transglycosylase domain-containing protein [Streptomyces zingiberis]NJQ00489.1 penicillin-binding protein [Streptomyces zingiberis]